MVPFKPLVFGDGRRFNVPVEWALSKLALLKTLGQTVFWYLLGTGQLFGLIAPLEFPQQLPDFR